MAPKQARKWYQLPTREEFKDLFALTMKGYDEVEKNPTLDPTTWLYAMFVWLYLFGLILVLAGATAFNATLLPSAKSSSASEDVFSEGRAMEHVKLMFERALTNQSASSMSYAQEVIEDWCGEEDDWGHTSCLNNRWNLENGYPAFEYYRNDAEVPYTYLDGETVRRQQDTTPLLVRVSDGAYANYTQNAILVTARYSMQAGSSQSLEDAYSVAIMLEMIRAILHIPLDEKPYLAQAIIFYFSDSRNDAKNMGAERFLRNHPWASTVKLVVSLDEFSPYGGKEMIFDYGPKNAWLIDIYSQVAPHPHANIIVKDFLHRDGFMKLPFTDTDFHTYVEDETEDREIVGLSLMYYQNGYWHDTTTGSLEDRLDLLAEGSLQHTGDNVLAFVREMAYSKLLTDHSEFSSQASVYYDVMGNVMITYNRSAAIISYVIVMLAGILTMIIRKEVRAKGKMLLIIALCFSVALSWGVGLTFSLIIATFCSSFAAMSWYSQPVFAVAMYGIPTAFGVMLVQAVTAEVVKRKVQISHGQVGRDIYKSITFGWGFALLFMLPLDVGLTYLPFWITLWMSAAFGLLQALRATIKRSKKFKEGQEKSLKVFISTWEEEEEDDEVTEHKKFSDLWALHFAAVFIFPTILTMDGFLVILRAVMPFSGYLGALEGSVKIYEGDVAVCIVVSLCVLIFMTVALPFIHRAGHLTKLATLLGVASVLIILISAGLGSSGTSVFNEDQPKRVILDMYYNTGHCVIAQPYSQLTVSQKVIGATESFSESASAIISTIDPAKSLDDVLGDSPYSWDGVHSDYHTSRKTDLGDSIPEGTPLMDLAVEQRNDDTIMFVSFPDTFYGPPHHMEIEIDHALQYYPFLEDQNIEAPADKNSFSVDLTGSLTPGYRFSFILVSTDSQEELKVTFKLKYFYQDATYSDIESSLPSWVSARKTIVVSQTWYIQPKYTPNSACKNYVPDQ
eukprot:TRINITY_DN1268_c0_g1::TRINITY_DN1268_c0_g1_i1::g.26875::m.26875 TRINITY_DN1268_c0_g1::TRINITY_DN1268_c0_g1_i1::g.26875  ORF type:complete len:959 (-),score=309.57,sp/Q3UVK0/ERMP1_MOUSE/26.88/5e-39,Peptidase_M28/PF04389.12/1.9e-05 TRINITY_DN1268_c0_g1_i1:450-3326(-)